MRNWTVLSPAHRLTRYPPCATWSPTTTDNRYGVWPEGESFMISRRTALRLLASASGAALVAACQPLTPTTPNAPTASSTSAAAAAKPGDQPRSGGILRQGNLGDLPTL